MTERIRGTICHWNEFRFFGFIKPDGDKPDVFVHKAALDHAQITEIAKGDKVEFAIEIARDGRPRACNLVLVERAPDVVERVGGGW